MRYRAARCYLMLGAGCATMANHLIMPRPDQAYPRRRLQYRHHSPILVDREPAWTCAGGGSAPLRRWLPDVSTCRLATGLAFMDRLWPVQPFETLIYHSALAVILARSALLNHLLTLKTCVSDMDQPPAAVAIRECIAQGVANTVTGFFGGMALRDDRPVDDQRQFRRAHTGCGDRCGRCPCCSLSYVGAPLIEQIPLQALVGCVHVVIGTFA